MGVGFAAGSVLVWAGLGSHARAAEPVPEDRPAIVAQPARAGAAAREASGAMEHVAESGVPSLGMVSTSVPPEVDGSLDDVCWQNAPTISDFTQVEPREGAAPTERTEVRLVHDRDYLFIAVRCFDREPNKILAKQMQREAEMESDDTISVTFDTFARKRTGYLFVVTPSGATLDALLEADGKPKGEWDTIWRARPRIDEQGWTVEIAIPFKSVSFDPTGSVWGFNVERVIRRKQEIVRWAAPYQNKSVQSIADMGQLRDLSGMRKGLGLEFKPFFVARHIDEEGGKNNGFDFDPGFDLFYSITPSLTAALTVNTDFAEAEVDKRQVNLTRFPLFFPEKRDFFLQDANLFSFGAYNGPLAFHSRRIGLSPSGETIDLLAGGKLTGRIGNLHVGFLDVQMNDFEGIPSKNLAVGRASYRVGEESSIGGMFTYGDPAGPGDNWLAGADINYRNSHVAGHNVLFAQAWGLRSNTDDQSGSQMAYGASVRYPNEPFSAEASFVQVDDDFNPALGFVERTGIRQYGAELAYRWRPGGWIRSIGLQVQPFIVTGLDNVIQTEAWTLPGIDITNEAGDSLNFGFTMSRENFTEAFEIQPGVVIPGADYRFNRGYVAVSSTPARPVSAYASVDVGEFYDGRSREFGGGVEWRISPHAHLGTEWGLTQVDLPGGEFDVVLGALRANFSFTPDLSWNTLIQYDNVSETVGVNSRWKWTIRPGSHLFLVFNYGFDVDNRGFRTISKEITTKLVWTWRF